MITLQAGEALALTVRIEPEGAASNEVTWESKNPAVATVDENGRVEAVANGDTTVVASTQSGIRAHCFVRVGELSPLEVDISHSTHTLTPLRVEAYSEQSTSFGVRVNRLASQADAERVGLRIRPVEGLEFRTESTFAANSKAFTVTVTYDGTTPFAEGAADIFFSLDGAEGYAQETWRTRVEIRDGQARARPIPVTRQNIETFNRYANTVAGLRQHYRLVANVTLAELPAGQSNWTPIGSRGTPFTGSFDGNNHTLRGLHLEADFDDAPPQGLFGDTSGAVVENLGLLDSHVVGREAVGSIVGRLMDGGTVQNCYTTGNVRGRDSVGGVVGYSVGSTVRDSYNRGSVSGITTVGGVVGFSHEGTVEGCHATGDVTGEGDYVGGVVGTSSGTVEGCHATGDVSSEGDHVGGVVGWSGDGTVRNSYATGSVTGGLRVGGVVGQSVGTVEGCHATGDVSGFGLVGGVVGYSGGTVQNSYATGDVSGERSFVGGVVGQSVGTVQNSYATGDVSGSGQVGGVVGHNSNGTVEGCHATGDVSSEGDYVGGVVGQSRNGTVEGCHATGNVSGANNVGGVVGYNVDGTVQNSYATGRVTGGQGVGGVVGWTSGSTVQNSYATGNVSGEGNNVGGVVGLLNASGTVQNSYATGNVTGKGNNIGGVVGWISGLQRGGTVENCYATGRVTGGDNVGGVVGNNRGDVRSCAALNPSIRAVINNASPLGRVVGTHADGQLSNNYARLTGMELSYGDGTLYSPTNGAHLKDGFGTPEHNQEAFWRGTLSWDFSEVWQWGPHNLPILRGVGGVQAPRVQYRE